MKIDQPTILTEQTNKQITTPSNPASGFDKLYFKNDDKLYKKTSAGAETEIGGGNPGGLTTQIQYNDGGGFAGNENFTFVSTLGTEKITNGTFTGGYYPWNAFNGWTYATNKVSHTSDGTYGLSQSVANMVTPIIPGYKYRLTYTVSGWTVGTITPVFGTGLTLTTRTGAGTYTEDFVALTTDDLNFNTSNTSRLSIDDVSIKQLTTTISNPGGTFSGNVLNGFNGRFGSNTIYGNGASLQGYADSNFPNTPTDRLPFQVVGAVNVSLGMWSVSGNKYVSYIKGDNSGNTTIGANGGYLAFVTGGLSPSTYERARITANGEMLVDQTSAEGTAKLQVTGSVQSKSGLSCSGTFTNGCTDIPLGHCASIPGCGLGGISCLGTHDACVTFSESDCETHGCTKVNTCNGTHDACSTWNADEAGCISHACTPSYIDPFTCACNNAYCENGACGDQISCEDPGQCNSTWHPDTMNCSCGAIQFNGCGGSPHACQTSECNSSLYGCFNTYDHCGGSPHSCQQDECDNSLYGCSNQATTCEGTPTSSDCNQLYESECNSVTGCGLAVSVPSYILKNDANSLIQTISNDGMNMVFNTDSGIGYFTGDVSATDFINRTSVYDKTKGSALSFVKDASEYLTAGKIDHTKFYGATTTKVQDTSRPEKKIVEKDGKSIEVTYYPHQKEESGVSLGDEVAKLEQALSDLIKLNKLKTK